MSTSDMRYARRMPVTHEAKRVPHNVRREKRGKFSAAAGKIHAGFEARLLRRASWATHCAATIIHATSATKTNLSATLNSQGRSSACDSRRVQTVYIPSGKTAPQYSGS